jgi:hypothetical protein
VRIVDETGAVVPETDFAPWGFLEVVLTREAPGDGLGGLDRGLVGRLGLGELVEPDRALPEGCTSVLRLRAEPPVHVSLIAHDATLTTERVDGPVDVLELPLDRDRLAARLGGVRVRFVDAVDGRPIEGGSAAVDLPRRHTRGGGEPLARGAAELSGRPPGLQYLRFFHADYAELSRSVRIEEGRVVDLGDVEVWPLARIRGAVLDARGAPARATVRAIPRAGLRGPADLDAPSSRATFAGQFDLDRAPRGPVQLLVESSGHAPLSIPLDTSSGFVEGLVLQLQAGVPVALEPVEGAAGLQATIADERGVPLATQTLGRTPFLLRLVPGPYRLWVGVAERVDRVEELVVGSEPVTRTIGGAR